ncbi:VOC family protein [Oceanobacillus chungangensis]|uniref:PhnB-like domain-containing protein n=1 Tax=Oceanobacillus chungangensis TaxID=1229152 RepID=A0A3D8PJC7_9BACI|nr:VOC family protein [Oceanobacillus chungangensis]RDW16200.1 hypothetical protein CWR45_15090 [Oceanobacillus chungangensis]
MDNLKHKVHPFLMFEGKAEEAMNLYTSVFDDAKIITIRRYAANEAGEEGTVMQAIFSIKGQEIMCSDSNVKHNFTFTPSISLFVTCDTEEELDHAFEALSQEGQVYMPLNNYGFSKKFGWVGDVFGVTWQLNLA